MGRVPQAIISAITGLLIIRGALESSKTAYEVTIEFIKELINAIDVVGVGKLLTSALSPKIIFALLLVSASLAFVAALLNLKGENVEFEYMARFLITIALVLPGIIAAFDVYAILDKFRSPRPRSLALIFLKDDPMMLALIAGILVYVDYVLPAILGFTAFIVYSSFCCRASTLTDDLTSIFLMFFDAALVLSASFVVVSDEKPPSRKLRALGEAFALIYAVLFILSFPVEERNLLFVSVGVAANILLIVYYLKKGPSFSGRPTRLKLGSESNMYVLGLEGTAHTAGVGAFSLEGELLLNLRRQYTSPSGGIHPREAAQFIARELPRLLEEAFDRLGTDIAAIGFSRGPGLGPCLRTVATAARFLASVLGVPLYGINHAAAHVEIGRREFGLSEPVALYLSGGNTAVMGREGDKYVVYGETLDIGLGNLLDTFAREAARMLGIEIPFPGGPHVERLAERGSRLYPLPYVVKGMNLSFSGLLKAALELLRSGVPIEDVAYSLQETAFSMAIEVLERALGFSGKREALLVGGVARNKRLRQMFAEMAEDRGIRRGVVSPDLAVDNGAMIAYVTLELYLSGAEPLEIERSHVKPRIDTFPYIYLSLRDRPERMLVRASGRSMSDRSAIKYAGIEQIAGPLVVVRPEGLKPMFGELVRIRSPDGERLGQVIEATEELAVVQVFEHTLGIDINASFSMLGETLRIGVSEDMLGRIFNGRGEPIDGYPRPVPQARLDVNGSPINPVMRKYPHDFIQTGISVIDVMLTLVRGQKLPLFSGSGLPHNRLAVQIARQAKVVGSEEEFSVVFAAMGITAEEYHFFRRSLEESGAMERTVMFVNLADDPAIERIITPRLALTVAEYLAFETERHVLVILTDMTNYAEALREISAARNEIPGRRGYPAYLYSDLASIYERCGLVRGRKGSITLMPILTMPNDDVTHPVPDLTGYITEGQIYLSRPLHRKGIYPPIDPLPSLSRLMREAIGKGKTTPCHKELANQLYAAYAEGVDLRDLVAVVGEEALSEDDKAFLRFADEFEQRFINQGETERSIVESIELARELLAILPENRLSAISDKTLERCHAKRRGFRCCPRFRKQVTEADGRRIWWRSARSRYFLIPDFIRRRSPRTS